MNPLQIKSKLPHAGDTIFTIMSALAAEHSAINLGQGFPDFGMSEELISLVSAAMKGGNNQYTHMNGYPPLRETIAEKVDYLYGASISAETEITITPGGTYALYTALTAILQPGDEVILFEPAFDCYIPAIEMAGAKVVPIPLTFPEYSIDWTLVAANINDNTRVILINSPHNPSGAILQKKDMEALRALTLDTRIAIVSDEVYEHLIFDGLQHESILRYPDLFARSFVCFSFGKVFHCTGWKMGYCIAPSYLMGEFRKIHQYNAFSCDTPKQVALSNFLRKRETYLELGAFLGKKRDYFQELMSHTRFKALPTSGSYFQLYSYASISEEGEKEFAIRLTREHGVTAIPAAAFYLAGTSHQVLRFCFAKKEATLDAAVERLAKVG
ncbi:MAG: methionine aminotransferase [Chitinophagaceae bacterium]